MAELFKWWKNKDIIIIICLLIGTVVISALCAAFIVEPWNAIIAIVLALVGGFTARKLIIKALDKWLKNQKAKKGD